MVAVTSEAEPEPEPEPVTREFVSIAEVSQGTDTVMVLPSMTVCTVVVAWLVGTAVVRVTVVFEHWLFLQAVTV